MRGESLTCRKRCIHSWVSDPRSGSETRKVLGLASRQVRDLPHIGRHSRKSNHSIGGFNVQFTRTLKTNSAALLLATLALLLAAGTARAQTSAFTYQGKLTDGGTPANGNYDLQFALWDSLSSGAQIGATQTVNTVAVS